MIRFNPKKEDISVLKGKEIDLLLENIYINKFNIKTYVYHIYLRGKYNKIGRITLRLGNNEDIYYFGNIGYSISKNYRGNYLAAKACLLIKELLKKYKIKSEIIITVNPQNIASQKTCIYIGCNFIETVKIPKHSQFYTYGNNIKCRYRMPIL